ncbi:MAG: inositol monophosphatase family protein [Chloroflexia bacterium]
MQQQSRHPLADDLALAQRAALRGAAVALGYWGRVRSLAQELKADGSIGTEADRAVETEVRRVLLAARPGDACLGEETGETGSGPRRWVLDGIDGTAVFVVGDDRWQILIALEAAGEVAVGVAILPAQGQIWWAARGHGAFVGEFSGSSIANARRLAVRPVTDLTASRLGIVPLVEALPEPYLRVIALLRASANEHPWWAHAALLVAAGELDLAVQVGGSRWDYAALALIVTEAGGAFARVADQPPPVMNTMLYSTGEPLHTAALALIH